MKTSGAVTDPAPPWHLPLSDLALSSDDVHVWCASLEQPAERVHRLARTLSADETSRAERFRLERDRRRFVVARGVLRAILGRYLGIDPSQLRFSYGEHGKPGLSAGFGDDTLRFNLAHSHELALYAFTRGREVGADLEYVRPLPDAGEIAAGFFSRRESAELEGIPDCRKPEAFFSYWTCKEAYVKAAGGGLARALDRVEISLAPGPARLLSVAGVPEEAARWSLRTLNPATGYVAAIAFEGRRCQLGCWRYEP
ncbi:MAG: 4'-phosphopantetheinyl transferase superfamily protein [Anaerolineae bacterium]|nr:4'-phosphopantetheinyl transferase superfamily protein [Anaerolineae bacterium]